VTGTVAVVLKGYPRLSETFIAEEILGLQRAGMALSIVALRHPTDRAVHPVHAEITAPVSYLPEYLYQEPARLLRGWRGARRLAGYGAALAAWRRDLRRDPTPNRVRRFGQALVLAHELPADVVRLHAHFLHTPASVARYAAAMRGLEWSVSAHARDIWTTPAWEIREKLADCRWAVTCSRGALAALAPLAPAPERVALVYHGIDLARFAAPGGARPARDGSDADDPVVLLTVGRAVPKKGHDVLIDALALLPAGLKAQGSVLLQGEGQPPEDLLHGPEARIRGLRGSQVGFVFQEPGSCLNPLLRVGFQICEGLRRHRGLRGSRARRSPASAAGPRPPNWPTRRSRCARRSRIRRGFRDPCRSCGTRSALPSL